MRNNFATDSWGCGPQFVQHAPSPRNFKDTKSKSGGLLLGAQCPQILQEHRQVETHVLDKSDPSSRVHNFFDEDESTRLSFFVVQACFGVSFPEMANLFTSESFSPPVLTTQSSRIRMVENHQS